MNVLLEYFNIDNYWKFLYRYLDIKNYIDTIDISWQHYIQPSTYVHLADTNAIPL